MKSFIALALAVVLGASTAASVAPSGSQAQQAQAEAPSAAQQQDPLKFDRPGRMLLVYQVPALAANDFVMTWRTIKDQLTKMNDPALTAFAQTLDIQRVETEPGADAVFVFDLDPVSTTYSYHPVKLLFETLKEQPDSPGVGLTYDQATELFEKIKSASAATWRLSSIG